MMVKLPWGFVVGGDRIEAILKEITVELNVVDTTFDTIISYIPLI